MAHRIPEEVRAYWEGLRNGHAVPARADVDPRGIERALEYSFLLERIAPGMARFRIAGHHLNDLMGMEVRGMPLSALFAPAGREPLSRALEEVFKGPSILDASLAAESGHGRAAISARLLILPLASDFGDVSRALGCLVAEGPIGRTPRRFMAMGSQLHPVAGETRPRPQAASRPGFAEFAESFTPAPPRPARDGQADQEADLSTPEARRAAFRLVKSGD